MNTTVNNVVISKLGKTRAGERSRIWLEGKRLTAYGFTRGMPFTVTTVRSGQWLIWAGTNVDRDPQGIIKEGTVAGTIDRPIIDTVGVLVANAFGTQGTHVRCEFHKGLIIVEALEGDR